MRVEQSVMLQHMSITTSSIALHVIYPTICYSFMINMQDITCISFPAHLLQVSVQAVTIFISTSKNHKFRYPPLDYVKSSCINIKNGSGITSSFQTCLIYMWKVVNQKITKAVGKIYLLNDEAFTAATLLLCYYIYCLSGSQEKPSENLEAKVACGVLWLNLLVAITWTLHWNTLPKNIFWKVVDVDRMISSHLIE